MRVYGGFATGQHEDCTYGTPKSLPRGAAYYLPNLVMNMVKEFIHINQTIRMPF